MQKVTHLGETFKFYSFIFQYSGWTAQAKALYVPVKVSMVFQSRYDVVVEIDALNKKESSVDKDFEAVDFL